MQDHSLIWITNAELEVTSFTARLRDLAGIGDVYSRVHVSDLWASDEPYGVVVIAHRWALEGEDVSFEAPAYGSTYRFELEPLHAPDGRIVGVNGRAVDLRATAGPEGGHERVLDRAALARRLAVAVARAGRRGAHCAVCFIDVDDFVRLRQACTAAGTDDLMARLATHLLRQVRAADAVARLSGGTFVVLLEDLTDHDQAVAAAYELLRSFDAPLRFEDGRSLSVGVSIGVAVAPQCSIEPAELLALADREMFLVRRNGGRGVKIATPCSPRYLADRAPFATQRSA
jgi:diguanylate cyclase (GGDEF)-like protein